MKYQHISWGCRVLSGGLLLGLFAIGGANLHAATIQISGSISAVAAISPGTPAALDSTQLTGGVTDYAVVTVNEKSNKKAGYTVTLQSANAGSTSSAKLVGASSGDAITYTIKYGGSAVSLVSGQAVVTNANDKTSSSGVDKVLSVSVPAGFPSADTYSDTLTLTLTNK